MISLNYRDARPIYEQVRDGLRHLMVTGAIAEGEKLPSVRALAASLAINPNTIQRAYTALEEEGYLAAEPGKGAFARRCGGANPRRAALLRRFDDAARELLFLGMTPQELAERINAAGAEGTSGAVLASSKRYRTTEAEPRPLCPAAGPGETPEEGGDAE